MFSYFLFVFLHVFLIDCLDFLLLLTVWNFFVDLGALQERSGRCPRGLRGQTGVTWSFLVDPGAPQEQSRGCPGTIGKRPGPPWSISGLPGSDLGRYGGAKIGCLFEASEITSRPHRRPRKNAGFKLNIFS